MSSLSERKFVCLCAANRRATRPVYLTPDDDLVCESCLDLSIANKDFDVIYVDAAKDVRCFADAIESEGFVVKRCKQKDAGDE